jgi:membrane-associated protease RseP (regulator of RpoE activity)
VGTGGTDTAGLAGGVDIQIGKLTLKDLTVGTIDLKAVEKRIGHPLPVILGKEVFNDLIVDIDFSERRIAFHDPEGFAPPKGAAVVPVTLVEGLRSVPVSVEGQPPVQFDFDIGNGSPLIVFPAYAETHKLLEGRPTSKALAGAIGGLRQNDVFTVRALTFAGVTFRDLPTTTPPPGPSGVDADRTLGNIGLPVLSRFRLITDYAHDRLYMTPDADAASRPFARDRLGVTLVKEATSFKVEFVAPNSPAAMAGLKAGDQVTSIDRKPPEAWSPDELRALRNSAEGVEVELTLSDGATKRLKARNYF